MKTSDVEQATVVAEVPATVGGGDEEEALLHTALQNDYGGDITKYLNHIDIGHLERCLPCS